MFQEDDVKKSLEESACLQRMYEKYIDLVIVNEDFDMTFRKVVEALEIISNEHQWVPVNWVYQIKKCFIPIVFKRVDRIHLKCITFFVP